MKYLKNFLNRRVFASRQLLCNDFCKGVLNKSCRAGAEDDRGELGKILSRGTLLRGHILGNTNFVMVILILFSVFMIESRTQERLLGEVDFLTVSKVIDGIVLRRRGFWRCRLVFFRQFKADNL